jgi:uncharacterized membrane protein YeiH
MSFLVYLLEIFGTAAFAASGSMLATKKNMDVFGVCIMGLISACGGGVIRDLFLGQLPPSMFLEPIYALTAIAVSFILFLPSIRRLLSRRERAYERIILLTDSAGLGIFTGAGVLAAVRAGYGSNLFFIVFLGVITGVGGGVLRDVLAGMPPYIFVKHIYASASILGAILCALLHRSMRDGAALLICCAAVVVIRLLAAHFRWSLPKADLKNSHHSY